LWPWILHLWLTFSPGLGSVVEFSGAALLQEILTLGVDPDAAELLQIFRNLDLAKTNHTDEYVRGRNFLPLRIFHVLFRFDGISQE
jgi:hypothetical protein